MTTKGLKIDVKCVVRERFGMIVGCMAWETPCAVFETKSGQRYLWVSEDVESASCHVSLNEGDEVTVQGFAYDKRGWLHLRRVRLTGTDGRQYLGAAYHDRESRRRAQERKAQRALEQAALRASETNVSTGVF